MEKVTPQALFDMKRKREKICALTAYDTPTASLLDEWGVDVILVGDSVGNVKLGHPNTLGVTMTAMVHHAQAVRRGVKRALLVADMPFMSCETGAEDAIRNAGRLVQEAGVDAVKIEGGGHMIAIIEAVVRAKIPVLGHIGLTPQSVLVDGGYRVQGRDMHQAEQIFSEAKRLESGGAFAVVLESMPAGLARRITADVSIPTIGIGAGVDCDGQILVTDDMLGLTPGRVPRFVRAYASLREHAAKAVQAYRDDVRNGRFPDADHAYD